MAWTLGVSALGEPGRSRRWLWRWFWRRRSPPAAQEQAPEAEPLSDSCRSSVCFVSVEVCCATTATGASRSVPLTHSYVFRIGNSYP